MLYDLVIIGGGPAGASAGRSAGKLGLRTLLIEKEKFPRYKPCGGAVSEQAISHLDYELPESLIEEEIFGARVKFNDSSVECKKKTRIAVLITRNLFDNYLLEKAKETKISIKTGEKVIKLKESNDFVYIQTNYRNLKSRFVIIAEGAHGRLKFKVRKRDKRNQFGICMVTEIKKNDSDLKKDFNNLIEIHFGIANMGYGWIFPHNEYYSVGVGGIAERINNIREVMNSFLKDNGFNNKYKIKKHVIPAGGINRKISTRRIILVGDAAGFVDSFYGEGISYAIRSGQIAVEVIYDIIRNLRKINYIKNYKKICLKEFGENLKISFLFSKFMHLFPNIFLRIFAENEAVLERYLDVPLLLISYKNFFIWLLSRLPKYLFSKSVK